MKKGGWVIKKMTQPPSFFINWRLGGLYGNGVRVPGAARIG